ncbi:MAG: STAS domain-containing protein [Thermoleophilaceae bacterium]|nr:STAS domain-containing protein [Thermoleophilaceae bacterium]
MQSFELTSEELEGGKVVVAFRGELDIAHVDSAEQQLIRLEQGSNDVVLDLRELQFLDSMGLRLILRADSRARDEGRALRIVEGPEQVQRVFRLTRMDERLEIVDSV